MAGSQERQNATNHTGWTTGDGRAYNNNICRSLTMGSQEDYYVYRYNFSDIPSGNIVTGIRVDLYIALYQGSNPRYNIGLCRTTQKQGISKNNNTGSVPSLSCNNASFRTHGNLNDLWGVTAANLQTYIEDNEFGVWIYHDWNPMMQTAYIDGFRIRVYWDLKKYGHDVNDVPADYIASVNEVPAAYIESVNEVS